MNMIFKPVLQVFAGKKEMYKASFLRTNAFTFMGCAFGKAWEWLFEKLAIQDPFQNPKRH
ncbi:MAG TPA: hypothetical protein VMW89_18455 [Desulfatiglandales bacterium]|nr:hypothetical protein [Desulfatiglandales bacterium]